MKRTLVLLMVAGSVASLAGCGSGGLFGPAQTPTATRGQTPLVKVWFAPRVDGKISGAWKKAPPLVLGNVMSEEVGDLKTTAYVLTDGRNLYVAWECLDPNTDDLIADAVERDGQVWNDDSVELFISPDIDKGYYQFAINSKGVLMDGLHAIGDQTDNSWDCPAKIKTSVERNKKWVVTMSVPLKELGATPGKDQTWRMNLNRTKPTGDQEWIESSWSSQGRSAYHDTEGWGKLTAVNID